MKKVYHTRKTRVKRHGAELPARYYENTRHRIEPLLLSPGEYARAIRSFVVVCVDALIVNRSKRTVFLAKRQAKPAQGMWWYIGGRVLAGETFERSIVRCFERETSLSVSMIRFEPANAQDFFWDTRQQRPQNAGLHSLGFIFSLELTEQERRAVAHSLDPHEYHAKSGLREFSRRELVREKIHPAVIETYDRIFS